MDELAQILVVEDDETIRTVLGMALAGAGFRHVRECARGDEAISEMAMRPPDLVLLDIMLPGADGYSVCRRIRETPALSRTRVLMLTAKSEPDDIVRGLDCGADDYVTKPFDRRVLLARVRALLRRGTDAAQENFDGLSIDESAHAAKLDGAELKLPRGEFRILVLLCANRGRVLSRQRILDSVQSDDAEAVTERTVDVQIANLRRKLGRWASHIGTVRGVGYRISP